MRSRSRCFGRGPDREVARQSVDECDQGFGIRIGRLCRGRGPRPARPVGVAHGGGFGDLRAVGCLDRGAQDLGGHGPHKHRAVGGDARLSAFEFGEFRTRSNACLLLLEQRSGRTVRRFGFTMRRVGSVSLVHERLGAVRGALHPTRGSLEAGRKICRRAVERRIAGELDVRP